MSDHDAPPGIAQARPRALLRPDPPFMISVNPVRAPWCRMSPVSRLLGAEWVDGMKRRNGAVLRCVAVGLLLLAMLIAPLTPAAAHRGGAGPVMSASLSHCTATAAWMTAMEKTGRDACPDPKGMAALGDCCMALGCHALHLGLPLSAALPSVGPPPMPIPIAATVLLDGVGVDPALKPPRPSL